MRAAFALGILGLVGCHKDPAPRKLDGPVAIRFGDCAAPTTRWVSGPRPLPFTPGQLAEAARRIEKVVDADAAEPDSDDPPVPDPGDTGGAMALEEGNLAQKSADRAADPRPARQQAIERARAAGILGSRALTRGGAFAALTAGGGGRGGMPGPAPAGPHVVLGQPTSRGDLDKALIRRYVKRNVPKIQACYALLHKPDLSGTVYTSFVIAGTGDVASASASGVDAHLGACVAGVIKTIHFPAPKGGDQVQVEYPFTWRPAAHAPAAGGPPPEPRAPAGEDDYQPGATNPLRAQQAALEACFRKNAAPHGAIVVELGYDAAGKATKAAVHGTLDEAARACVVAAARQVSHPGVTAERCAIAFGDLSPGALPGVDLTADAIRLDGKPIAKPGEIAGDPRLDVLNDALGDRRRALWAATAPVVTLHGPLALRPRDDTPMGLVRRAIRAILLSGDDVVLAAAAGSEWKLLAPIALPVVPVPLGTGGTWNHIKGLTRDAWFRDGGERVVLSVLVTRTEVVVGMSRINEVQRLPRAGALEPQLLRALETAKHGAQLLDRDDCEIAAEDDVPYADLVAAIRAATAAGFTRWQLTEPPLPGEHPIQ